MTEPTLEAAPTEVPETGTFPFATWGGWIAIGATLAALITGLLLSLPFLAFDGGGDRDDLGLGTTIAIQICTGIGFLMIPLLLSLSTGGGQIRAALGRLGFKRFEVSQAAKWVSLGILTYFVFSIAYSVIIGTPKQDDIAADFGPIPLQILLIVVIAPIAEEVCFRGMLFGGIRTKLPLWAAAPAAGAVFGLLHYSTGWSAVPPLIVLGAVFAVVYEKSGSLWPVILMHAVNNALALAVLNS